MNGRGGVDGRMAYLVIRLRGTVNVPYWARHTLRLLNLERRFNATIVPEREPYIGMLRRVKEHVAWCRVDASFIRELLEKRGSYGDLTRLGFSSIDELAEAIASDKVVLSRLEGVRPWFALAPPRGGFRRSSKHMHSDGGILGENRELIELAGRMIQ
ncbi:MAG: uL30 family ribosomal protein [Candidatus Nitrosocaldus sp.]|nr:uL30 family ribosomal protein [Candidatus Nitrosocaldus sp.]